jgi:hypothetical protein
VSHNLVRVFEFECYNAWGRHSCIHNFNGRMCTLGLSLLCVCWARMGHFERGLLRNRRRKPAIGGRKRENTPKSYFLCRRGDLDHDPISWNTLENLLYQKSLTIANLMTSPTP